MKLLGYILDEEDFEVIPTVNRMMVMTEVTTSVAKPRVRVTADKFNSLISFNIVVKPQAENSFTTVSEFDVRFNEYVNIENVISVVISVDNVVKTLPFTVAAGQTIGIYVNKDVFATSKFTLKGELI
jgi:hypothetical protein